MFYNGSIKKSKEKEQYVFLCFRYQINRYKVQLVKKGYFVISYQNNFPINEKLLMKCLKTIMRRNTPEVNIIYGLTEAKISELLDKMHNNEKTKAFRIL